MSAVRAPITLESFPAVWKYAVRKNYWAKKKSAVRGVLTFVSQILFFVGFLILTYGAFYDRGDALFREMLNQVPQLAAGWQKFSAWLFAGAGDPASRLVHALVFLYGLPLAAALVIFLGTVLFYHPRKPVLPEQPKEKARELWVVSEHIRGYSRKSSSRAYAFCGLFLGLFAAGLVVMYFLYYSNRQEIAMQAREIASQSPVYFVVGVFGIFLAYWLIGLPLMLVERLLHRT